MILFEKRLSFPEELPGFLEAIRGLKVKKIYNLGSSRFYESPLFLCMEDRVVKLFFDETLLLTVYDHRFWDCVKNGIFRDPLLPQEFDYIDPEPKEVEDFIVEVRLAVGLPGIDVIMKSGARLHIQCSDLVRGTMDSWID